MSAEFNVRAHLMSFVEPSDIESYAQPSWNQKTTLVRVQEAIEAASSRPEAEKACCALLYAVGNNHAGTYFPVALAMFPFFGHVLRHGSEWSRFAILEALTDLSLSFEPEPGHENFAVLPSDRTESLKSLLLARVGDLREVLESIATGNSAESASAQDLLHALREEP